MYRFCNGDLNRFVLLLQKGFSPYEYMDSWERFNEISKSNKKAFYSKLNLEDITDEDHAYVKKSMGIIWNKKSGRVSWLYVQRDTLFLADGFENFRDKCIEIYGPDPAHFLSASGLAWQACLKKQE